MKGLLTVLLTLSLAGCATVPIAQKPIPIAQKVAKKHVEPCPCSPTANQAVAKRWYDGFKVRWFH